MVQSLGAHLEFLRGKMSLREAADKSGLSHTYIRDLELGVRRSTGSPINPSPETLKRLADAYGASYKNLMEVAGYLDTSQNLTTPNGNINGNDVPDLSLEEILELAEKGLPIKKGMAPLSGPDLEDFKIMMRMFIRSRDMKSDRE